VTIPFNGLPGRTYVLEAQDPLAAGGPWSPVSELTVGATTAAATDANPGPSGRVYRVRALP
jgi:hypothetical protein